MVDGRFSQAMVDSLVRHRDEIAAGWTSRALALGDPRAGSAHSDELARRIDLGYSALIDYHATGSFSGLESYLDDWSSVLLELDLPCPRVLELLLLLREVATPLLDDDDLKAVDGVTGRGVQLDRDISRIASRFCAVSAPAIHHRQRALTRVEERSRLARDLHDSVTQSIYGMTLLVETARRKLRDGQLDSAVEGLEQISGLALESLAEMRMLIFELHPPSLERLGLAGVLQMRLEAIQLRHKIETSLRIDGEVRPPLRVEDALLRIAMELLTNTLRHAAATRIDTVLVQQADGSTLEVIDDGVGFDPSGARANGGCGLAGIEERTRRIDGHLEIDSSIGAGTRVRVSVSGARR